mgnify:CR=1 FL=1
MLWKQKKDNEFAYEEQGLAGAEFSYLARETITHQMDR